MRARKPLLLFLSLAVGLGLLTFLISTLFSRPSGSLNQPPALEVADSAPIEESEPLAATSTDVPAETLLGDEGSARVSATQPPVEAANRDENFALDGARELSVRVVYPSGTPADESPTVWLFARKNVEAVDQRELDMLANMDPEEMARSVRNIGDIDDEDRESFWSHRSLDESHRVRMPYPPEAQQLVVLLDGNYLYLADLVVLEAASAPAELALEPALGARLHGHCVLPAGAERRDVNPLALDGQVELNGMAMRHRANGEPRMFHRQWPVTPEGEFEARALPADVSLIFQVEVVNLLGEQRIEAIRLAPGESREVEARFRLGSSIRGRVIDPSGKGVANASVWSEGGDRGRFGMGSNRNKTTDKEGGFALHGLTAGERSIHAQAGGWKETQSDTLTLGEEQEVTDLTITLEVGSRIAGKVHWPDETPASEAQVTLYLAQGQRGYRWRNTVSVETSAEDGSFAFSGLTEGSYSIEASAYHPTAASPVDAAEEGPEVGKGAKNGPKARSHLAQRDSVAAGTVDVALVLQETLSVAGRVIDDLGQPLGAFQVSAGPSTNGEKGMDGGTSSSEAFEAPDGRFVLGGLYPGEWKVTASADGHHMAEESLTVLVPQGEQALEIRLARSATLSGIVQDPRGVPVAGARVGPAQGASEQSTFFRGQRDDSGLVTSDAAGHFTIVDLAAGVFVVEASAKDWAVSEPVTVDLVPGAAVEGVIVQLRNGGTIVGDVFDESGEPLIGRQVTLGMAFFALGMDGSPGETSDAAGHFVFTHVDPGRYAVTLSPPQDDMLKLMNGSMNGGADESAMIAMMSNVVTENVTVLEGQESYVRLGAEPKVPVRVYGKVIEAGEPVPSGMVFGITEGHALMQGMKVSKIEDGHYEFTVDRPGAYTFGVQTDQGDAPLEFHVDVPAAESVEQDLVLPRGAISGRVFGPDGGPAPFAELRLSREDSGFSLSLDTEGRSADAEGHYEVAHLRPGVYTVRAGGGSRYGAGEDDPLGVEIVTGIRVEEDRSVEGIDLHLRGSGSIEGTVTDRSDKPVGGIAIFVRDERGLLLNSVSPVTTEANGTFVYKGVAPGRVTVSARGQGLAACEGPVVDVRKGEASEIEIRVDSATMLNVTVEDEQGESMRATIQVLDERGHEVAAMYSQLGMETLMMEGLDSKKTRVGPLPPGKYEVRATAKDGRTSSKPVNLSGKEERNLRIKIRD